MGYKPNDLGYLRPHRHPGERAQAGMVIPGDISHAASRRLARRMKWFKIKEVNTGEVAEGEASQYSVDVTPAIAWGHTLENTPPIEYTIDVRPGIEWGLLKENTPDSQYSYDTRPSIEWGYRITEETESQCSYDVRPGIEWAGVANFGFTAPRGGLWPAASNLVRQTFGTIAVGDEMLDENPPNVWAPHNSFVTDVETSGSYVHIETDDAIYGHLVLWENVKTISQPSPESGPLWRGAFFYSEAGATAYYNMKT